MPNSELLDLNFSSKEILAFPFGGLDDSDECQTPSEGRTSYKSTFFLLHNTVT